MVYHGHVENGAILLDGAPKLPEGAVVELHLISPRAEEVSKKEPPWFKFIGAIKDMPPDASQRIDEVLYGHRKEWIKYFADTAFFVGLLNERDERHPDAKRLVKEYAGRILTTYWVLLELANYFASTRYRETAGDFIDGWLSDPAMECVLPGGKAFHTGLKLYRGRQDKEWSLTDCMSFNLMRERGVTEALTSDHHFEQAGFRILLK
jgi:uncharacterized protein